MSTRSYQPPWRRALSYAFLALLALVFIFPFAITVATSFKTEPDASANAISLIPHPPTLTAWQQIFGIGANASVTDFPRWFMNSVLVATAITLGRVFLDSLAGYALARLGFRGRKLVFGLVVATLAVPGVVLLIPRFLVLKELGLFNSYPGMILPIIVDATGIFLMRQFFLQVPVSLEEAGEVDGASIWRICWSIVLPVVRPGLITLAILSFQGSWNEFQFFLISTISPEVLHADDRPGQYCRRRVGRRDPVPARTGRLRVDDPADSGAVLRVAAVYNARPDGGSREGIVKGIDVD